MSIGIPVERMDGRAKVTGTAPYAYEHPVVDPLYLHLIQSTITRGHVTGIDTVAAEALPGVAAVLTHHNAPRLAADVPAEFRALQSGEIVHHGQIIAGVVAESPQIAQHAAELVRVTYDAQPHDTRLRADHPELYKPEMVAIGAPADSATGDADAALASAVFQVDQTYTTPAMFHSPIEPHATTAIWGDSLTVYEASQGVHDFTALLAQVLDFPADRIRVIAPYVGGAFGSKGLARPHAVLAALASRVTGGRAVKVALTRRQMFALTNHRPATVQRVRLGADADGQLTALVHDATVSTARYEEYVEWVATSSRNMYATPNRRTTHRAVRLDVQMPAPMRAPGEAQGHFATETAMDELAAAVGMDPIELRIRNEPPTDADTGLPWSGRHLVDCLRLGAHKFGWADRAKRRQGDWLIGTGVAAATLPTWFKLISLAYGPSNAAVEYVGDGRYLVGTGASDAGTGARTALSQIAADALGVPLSDVELELGDNALPRAMLAAGSMGTMVWGSAIVAAAQEFRRVHGTDPKPGARAEGTMAENPNAERVTIDSFHAVFAEAAVHADTGEIRVPRLLGVFDIGRVVNPRTVRSQLIGGMTMGLSMALHESGTVDERVGAVVNNDFAGYHIATHADVADIDAVWLGKPDPYANEMGIRPAGENGVIGVAAAVANAVHHATGVRIRDLPITPDKLVSRLAR
ncbi:xanthine dehydrogenase family protein molybdopterin-binding subunit [Kibdelosporangium phytohabitans]|uniref:xanthine dehydrogenase family protein molybdopterin-binding subunit n=1 Tax=Kibdelosporangium phytohabitans TaxID=860235 RepID=UPI00178BB019|nr:xanthine dehydrogenase family protein molybdopterin-binding subunit [Kibdelosporangium phytohabitans]MBE1465241.1 xanthine dehydrogenase YagR molybdenum-binding subunit [Kibdelosporangium phytohabitans]